MLSECHVGAYVRIKIKKKQGHFLIHYIMKTVKGESDDDNILGGVLSDTMRKVIANKFKTIADKQSICY